MADVPLPLLPEHADRVAWPAVNPIVRLLRGVDTGGVILRGDLGTRRDLEDPNTETGGHYTAAVQSKATGGLHAAFILSGTATTAAPTIANSAVLIDDTGLRIGPSSRLELERIRVFEPGRVDYADLTSLNGELLLSGSGSAAGALTTDGNVTLKSGSALRLQNAANTAVGQFAADAGGTIVLAGTTGNLAANGNLGWLSGTSNLVTLDHAATAARTVTFQDLAGTVALLGASNAGHLLWTDNTYDLGAAGATRPRTAYLGTSLNVAAGAQLLTASDVTLTAPWTAFTPTVTQGGSVSVTVDRARYRLFGKQAVVQIQLSVTSSGTANNDVLVTIPSAIQSASTGAFSALGTMQIYDSGTGMYVGVAFANSATTIGAYGYNAAAPASLPFGRAPNFGLASGDKISLALAYEVA